MACYDKYSFWIFDVCIRSCILSTDTETSNSSFGTFSDRVLWRKKAQTCPGSSLSWSWNSSPDLWARVQPIRALHFPFGSCNYWKLFYSWETVACFGSNCRCCYKYKNGVQPRSKWFLWDRGCIITVLNWPSLSNQYDECMGIFLLLFKQTRLVVPSFYALRTMH